MLRIRNNSQIHNSNFITAEDLKQRIIYASKWLSKASDVCKGAGVSHSYNLLIGWDKAYPETTGYIIPTFLNLSTILNEFEYEKRALKLGEWLLKIQDKEGWYQAGKIGDSKKPSIFNTAQIIFGLNALYRKTKNKRFKIASYKAADWIANNQEKNGSWEKFTYKNTSHSYYIRVSQALLENYKNYGQRQLKETIEKNLEWVKSNYIKRHTWFLKSGFRDSSIVHLHTIAYLIEGLLNISSALQDDEGIKIGLSLSQKISSLQNRFGWIPGGFKEYWKCSNYACLTGISQMAYIWYKIHRLFKNSDFIENAKRANSYVMTKQNLNRKKKNLFGGIPGSYPIWGKYLYFRYPNWAAKFYIDALIQQIIYDPILNYQPERANENDYRSKH